MPAGAASRVVAMDDRRSADTRTYELDDRGVVERAEPGAAAVEVEPLGGDREGCGVGELAGGVGDEAHVLDEMSRALMRWSKDSSTMRPPRSSKHQAGGRAVPNELPAGAGIDAHGLGDGERFGGDGDMEAAQQLVDELDLLAVAEVRSDDGPRCAAWS
jgi:hypothetical protein